MGNQPTQERWGVAGSSACRSLSGKQLGMGLPVCAPAPAANGSVPGARWSHVQPGSILPGTSPRPTSEHAATSVAGADGRGVRRAGWPCPSPSGRPVSDIKAAPPQRHRADSLVPNGPLGTRGLPKRENLGGVESSRNRERSVVPSLRAVSPSFASILGCQIGRRARPFRDEWRAARGWTAPAAASSPSDGCGPRSPCSRCRAAPCP